jgi:hypothetical protein
MRANAIDHESKNGKSIHFFILSVWASPSVEFLELFDGLMSGQRKAFQKLMR